MKNYLSDGGTTLSPGRYIPMRDKSWRSALKLTAIAAVALSLGACSSLQTAWSVATSAGLTPTAVIVAGNSFDAGEATATNYLKLPTCATGGPTICKTPAAVSAIVPVVRAGRQERNALESACAANVTAANCVSAYNALTSTVGALQSLFTQYNVQKGS